MPAMGNPTAVRERVQYVADGRQRLATGSCPHCADLRPAQLTCPVCGQGVVALSTGTLRTRWLAHLDATATPDNQPAPITRQLVSGPHVFRHGAD